MFIRYGYEIVLTCPQETPLVCLMDIHPDRAADIQSETVSVTPYRPQSVFIDMFGNKARRLVAPAGDVTLACSGLIYDEGLPDRQNFIAVETPVADLPPFALPFLLGSRYCETDRLSQQAWGLFGHISPGWGRVQAIMDFVHGHVTFGYEHARATRTAFETFHERVGVCRDFAHLALTLCRCMNIPARYVNGYLGDIGVPYNPAPMDFNAWIEVYLGDRWHTFDARHNTPRIGRVVIARGRDAADTAMISSFGPHVLKSFKVVTEEAKDVIEPAPTDARQALTAVR
ncbi:MAG: transglutaminase family protein [Hyphomicrobiales bacterium]|nr:transglutaminase family protein [Hyphomicrobiales bacterium]